MTIEKLRYLLSKATAVFGDRRVGELTSQEIAEWRMTLSPGYRFEATQALRQVLQRAVAWGMIDVNPAKVGVDNPTRRRKEQHPFESWAELEAIASAIGPRYGPMILFAAATGLRPAEWIALERRDVDRAGARRLRAPLVHQARAEDPEDRGEHASGAAAGSGARCARPDRRMATARRCCFPASEAATSTSITSARSSGGLRRRPRASTPLRRVYDLRHTFATFALRAGISTFDLSRYMGASLTMIDRHYGHLARDGREHAIKLLDALNAPEATRWTLVDVAWTPKQQATVSADNRKRRDSRQKAKPSDGLEPSTPSLPWRCSTN